ncbi:nucleotidyltransferase domain-containing protein [Paenibacillus sp. 1001270B_150601_E10]|uniref:nucleotidyltransferase domain-containing protein n=1 Tax=Paenibacillus sp. 1001270B_150601_E10 TaxID=2787079 RepID=UPI00189D972B|nr:nucleotidyltransferase domain-containing protein [Paenibacillus sp. 1001270B_150601_E10]
MNSRSENLIRTAAAWIKDCQEPSSYACIGGSVARGDADLYSDVDLTLYGTKRTGHDQNFIYKGEYIQLEECLLEELPTKEAIARQPWAHRFWNECYILQDEDHTLCELQSFCRDYVGSEGGRQRMLEEVTRIAHQRLADGMASWKAGNGESAAIACFGAWAEAAYLYMWLAKGSLATGELIPLLRETIDLDSILMLFFTCPTQHDVWHKPVSTVKALRAYLISQGTEFPFGLSDLQNQLIERKAARYMQYKDWQNISYQLYAEALWLYFETSNGVSFEDYKSNLPSFLQREMEGLGFVNLSQEGCSKLQQSTEELLHLSEAQLLRNIM